MDIPKSFHKNGFIYLTEIKDGNVIGDIDRYLESGIFNRSKTSKLYFAYAYDPKTEEKTLDLYTK